MPTGVATRSQKNKDIKSKMDGNLNSSNSNTSYVAIVSGSDKEENAERELVTGLRDRLAAAEYRVQELEDQLTRQCDKVEFFKNKCSHQKDTIETLQNTIGHLTEQKSRNILVHAGIQTETDAKVVATQTEVSMMQEKIIDKICNSKTVNQITLGTSLCRRASTEDKEGVDYHAEGRKNKLNKGNKISEIDVLKVRKEDNAIQNIAHKSPRSARKILVLGDSHVRGSAVILNSSLCAHEHECIVQTICKPNALFRSVVADVHELVGDFGFEDYVIVEAGSNDILKGITFRTEIVSELLTKLAHTNVLFLSVPFASGRLVLNNLIADYNYNLYKILLSYGCINVGFIDVNKVLGNGFRNIDGFHMSKRGKRKMFDYIVRCLDLSSTCDESVKCFINTENLIQVNVIDDCASSNF